LDKKGILTNDEKVKLKQSHVDYENGTLDPLVSLEFELLILKKIPLNSRLLWRDDFFNTSVQQYVSKKRIKLIQEYKQQN
jgi:hypothetical protein